MSAAAVEVVFLRPRLVPQAQGGGIGVKVVAEEPRALQLPAPFVVRQVRGLSAPS